MSLMALATVGLAALAAQAQMKPDNHSYNSECVDPKFNDIQQSLKDHCAAHTLGNLDFIAKVVNTGYQVATCNAHESNLYPGNVYSISKNVTDTLSGCKAISDKPDADAQLILDALNKGLFGGQPAESSASLQNHAVENGPATGTAQSTQISAASSSVPFIASGIPVPSASGAATHNATANTTAGGGNSTTLRNNAAATSAGGNSTQTAGALDMRAGGREMVFALGTASVVALGAVLVL